jgi:hypothetical protein
MFISTTEGAILNPAYIVRLSQEHRAAGQVIRAHMHDGREYVLGVPEDTLLRHGVNLMKEVAAGG